VWSSMDEEGLLGEGGGEIKSAVLMIMITGGQIGVFFMAK